MNDTPPRRPRVFDDPLDRLGAAFRHQPRGHHVEPDSADLGDAAPPAPVAGHPEAAPAPRDLDVPEEAAPASPGTTQRAERANMIADAIDRAAVGITGEIDNLIARAERLKAFVVDDASRIKVQLQAHIGHGTRVVDMAHRIEAELLELERNRRDLFSKQSGE